VPVGDVLVGDTGGNIEHDNTALSVDVVTVTETTKLLLTSGIPDIELDSTVVLVQVSNDRTIARLRSGVLRRGMTYGVEKKRVNLNTESGDVLLLEFTSQVTLDECGLFSDCVSNEVAVRLGQRYLLTGAGHRGSRAVFGRFPKISQDNHHQTASEPDTHQQ
jgi:hypothetical protein